ncbi:MAG: 30S ribosomal protein S20, partial [Clostridia bacterium]|nr:30S ribosomal protein S20 [Clostridia bacterium]
MPNIKSAIKRVELIRKRTAINNARKSMMKTA